MMDATRTARLRAIETRIAPLLGPGAATSLGLASGFFLYAMPATVIGRAFDPAAIGGQGLVAGVVALAVSAATWAGFARFDRPVRSRPLAIAARVEEAPPVLRRADAHPDAPPRRPIFAGSDLGTPLDLIDPLPVVAPDDIATPPPAVVVGPIAERPDAESLVAGPASAETVAVSPAVLALPAPPVTLAPPLTAPVQPLQAMMKRLEAGLVRKALVLAGAEPNVTALRREIRPIGGSLADAVETLQRRTASRR